jgi:hypothetical protein
MDIPIEVDVRTLGIIALLLMGGALLLALLLLGWVIWRIGRIELPADAGLLSTLRATPFLVVLLLDLLDFSLDFLSAPISWIVLSRLGLAPLRGVTAIEGLVPGTQLIPTMTAAWLVARLVKRDRRGHAKRV